MLSYVAVPLNPAKTDASHAYPNEMVRMTAHFYIR